MLGSKDKVSDVVGVLKIIRHQYKKIGTNYSVKEMRLDAVKIISDIEYENGRYLNQKSAYHTIHDALARRLRPDVPNIIVFDKLVENWLFDGSMELKHILLGNAQDRQQKIMVEQLFSGQ